ALVPGKRGAARVRAGAAGEGRTQVSKMHASKKRAQDARPRPKPHKPKAERTRRDAPTTRQGKNKEGMGQRGERDDRGAHTHDDRHNDKSKPNVHYRYPD